MKPMKPSMFMVRAASDSLVEPANGTIIEPHMYQLIRQHLPITDRQFKIPVSRFKRPGMLLHLWLIKNAATRRLDLSLHSNLGYHGHSKTQKELRILAGFENDLNRYTLYHFYVIAGRVLRRQEAEEGSGCAGDVEDMTVVGAAVGVDRNFHRLSGAHVLHLRF